MLIGRTTHVTHALRVSSLYRTQYGTPVSQQWREVGVGGEGGVRVGVSKGNEKGEGGVGVGGTGEE